MEELPSQSHKSREPREIQPVTISPGRVRKAPMGRRLLDTFFLGDFRGTVTNMIWNTFFPNLRENFGESLHDGVDSLLHGTEGAYRPRGRGGYRNSGSQITKHNPDRALGRSPVESRMSPEDRDQQRTNVIELGSRAEAEEVLRMMNQTLDQYDLVTLAEFYQMVRMTPAHTDYKFGWEDLGGAKVAHSRGSYYLDLPPVIQIR